MVVYSVRITVQNQIYDQWVEWLKTEHIKEVLACEGFVKAELRLGKSAVALESSSQEVLVDYYVESDDLLKKYLKEKAMDLRQKGMDLFPGQYSATREVWQNNLIISNVH
ncbi:MAG TPA: DUF4286 family protein [Pseudobdellovibrionaceae bacterium]|nr:DUF4286 family protein [Pseudobdellovibrionaceae bacterium]